MKTLRGFRARGAWRAELAAMATVLVASFGALGDIVQFQIRLDGSQQVPPVTTTATGSGTATLDTGTGEFSWNITFTGIHGQQTAAHFHGPAPRCAVGDVLMNLSLGSPIVGSAMLSQREIEEVLAQEWYVNIHTTDFPNGEIRGQINHLRLVEPLPDPVPASTEKVRVRTVATGLTAPNWGTHRPGHPERLMVVDQNGKLWDIDRSTGEKRVFLDVTSRLVPLGINGQGTFDERGFLGVAFHPDYLKTGLLYTFTSQPVDGEADFTTLQQGQVPNCQTVITEWAVPNPADPESIVDPDSDRELLRIDKPQFNHNGGGIEFSPLDGLLYISLGDGGNRDDEGAGHPCVGNGQDKETILGTILRIDPSGSNSGNGQYGIPEDNPFVNKPGLDEIFAYGFRNPFRFSFDRESGDLYAADVGQGDIEEIDVVVSGGNYGWARKEGSFYFVPNGSAGGYVTAFDPGVPSTLIDPIAEYDHDEGIAVVGGFVYRGTRIPALWGSYVFGDWNLTFFGNNAPMYHLNQNDDILELSFEGRGGLQMSLHGMGEDASGELYILANIGGVPFGNSGQVLKLLRGGAAGLESFEVVTGLLLAGDEDDLVESDNQAVRIRSGFGGTLNDLHKMDVLIHATSTNLAPDSIDLVIESRVNQPAGSMAVRLRNWGEDRFDTVGTHPLAASDSVFLATVPDADRYVAKDGAVEVLVRHLVVAPVFAFTFESHLDQIELFAD